MNRFKSAMSKLLELIIFHSVHAKVEHPIEEVDRAIPDSAFEASLQEFTKTGRWNDGSDDEEESED